MTVSVETNRVVYTGAGITGPFAVPFYFLENDDVKAVKTLIATGVETALIDTTDYVLTGAGVAAGGSMTLVAAIPATFKLTIYRDPDALQAIDFTPNDKFPADTAERGYDKLTMLVQRFRDLLSRAARLSDGDVSGASVLLPTPVANAILAWNATGTAIVNALSAGLLAVSAFGLTLLNAATQAAARTLLGSDIWCGNAGGTANAITLTPTAAIAGYNTGDSYAFKATATNTTAVTVAISGQAAIAAQSDGNAMVGGEIVTGKWYRATYDGAALQIERIAPALTVRVFENTPNTNIIGGYLDWTVAANALTVAIKANSGNDPSPAEPVFVDVRSVTATDGKTTRIKIVAANSIVVPNTALMGTTNNAAFRLWGGIVDDGGTYRMWVLNALVNAATSKNIYPLQGWQIISSTLVGAAANVSHVFYTAGAGVANKAAVTLGYATWEAGLAAAGTWSAGPTRKQLWGPGVPLPGTEIGSSYEEVTASTTTAAVSIPCDDTVPQIGEGLLVATSTMVFSSGANVYDVTGQVLFGEETNFATAGVAALFRDAGANAIAAFTAKSDQATAAPFGSQIQYYEIMVFKRGLVGSSGSSSFSLRAGLDSAGTTRVNGNNGVRQLGGCVTSYVKVKELMA